MAYSYTERKRIRKSFGTRDSVLEVPYLLQMQKDAYTAFLQADKAPQKRTIEGLQAAFDAAFPIVSHNGFVEMKFIEYNLAKPAFDVRECQTRGLTFASAVRAKVQLIIYDRESSTSQSKVVKEVKEQEVYMGEVPLMTDKGSFIINGTERVIVSQLHRSPGVFFEHDKGKTHSSGKLLFSARIIPYRGSWLDFEFDAKDVVYVRIDRRRKLPATTFLMGLGMDGEEILKTFYETVPYEKRGEGWVTPYKAERWKGVKPEFDLVDADTGEVIAQAGQKISARAAKKLGDTVKTLLLGPEALTGRYLARDEVNPETGEIYAEAGDELDATVIEALEEKGFKSIDVLDIDHVTVGAYMRNTVRVDKNVTREDALFDIYRVMRPGEPPTVEAAEAMFRSLFFDSERYDLSSVGRVKMNMRLGLDAEDTVTTLRKEDILAVVKELARFREDYAQRHNVPRSRVMKDDALLELASTRPANVEELGRSRLLLREARRGGTERGGRPQDGTHVVGVGHLVEDEDRRIADHILQEHVIERAAFENETLVRGVAGDKTCEIGSIRPLDGEVGR